MAMSGFHEIEVMSRTAEPDIAVITNIGTAHMEMLGSRENICKAKFEMLAGLKPDGVLILNGDEPMMLNYPKKPEKTIFIALKNSGADYYAYNIRQYDRETVFDMSAGVKIFYDIRIPALGNHNVYAALFAWAVGDALGMDEEEICRGLMKYHSADMRQKIYSLGGITVIEDCYNASPESMRAAVDVLCGLKKSRGCRAFALLGDMRELGMNTEMYHRSVGAYAAECGVDKLFTIGSLSRYIAAGAVSAGMNEDHITVNLDDNTYAATAAELAAALKPGDLLLVKASRAVRAERVISSLGEIYKGSEHV
jgi:UDP-N-acetylmuramoyl-tripeptide--D-alanyl-D-alanine ligase